MADQKYTVEVDFTLGQQSKAKLEAEVAEVKRKASAPGQQVGGAFPDAESLNEWKRQQKEIEDEMNKLGATQKEMWEKGTKANKEYQKQLRDSTRTIDEIKQDVLDSSNVQEDAQAQALKNMRQRATALRAESSVLRRSAADLELFSRAALVSGTALLGGVFAFANKYVKEAEHATAVTVKWKAAQDDIHKSSQRIGAVLAKEALPFLNQAARFMQQAAAFIEAHPEVVPAAVRAGEILIGIGVIGKAVATGIRLTADSLTIQSAYIRYQAATLDDVSADKYLAAAELNAESAAAGAGGAGGGAAVKSLGGLAAGIGEVLVPLAGFAVGLIAADKFFDTFTNTKMDFKDYVTELKQSLAIDAFNLGNQLSGIRTVNGTQPFDDQTGQRWFKKVGEALGLLQKKADDAAKSIDNIDLNSVANSPAKDQILNAYEDLLKDEAEMTRKYGDDKRKINEDAINDELQANRRYANDVQKINENLSKSLSKASADFVKANSDAEVKYKEQHDQILQDQADSLAKIQEQLQEKLRKMEQDNQNEINDLLAQRDAVGLIKQQRKYQQERADAIREAASESKQRKEETAKRLAELKQQYEEEKAQRAVEYADRIKELRQEAADRLKELQIQHTEELNRIREQRNEKLRELDIQFKAERDRRYQYFVAQIRDLDSALLGEKKLTDAYHDKMLHDLDAWLALYRSHLSTGLNSITAATPTKDSGGYVSRGLYRMAWDNQKEFVMSGPTTRAAERILGQNLSQELVVRGLTGGTNASYIDQRRMEAPLSKEQLALARESAIEAMSKVIGGA